MQALSDLGNSECPTPAWPKCVWDLNVLVTVALVGSGALTGMRFWSGVGSSCVQLLGHLHWLVHIRQNYSLLPAVSETASVAVPSIPQRTGLCRGNNSLSQPAPGGWCCKQSSRRHPALGLCGLGKVFALLRCLGFIPPPGPVWDKQSVGSGGAHNPLSIPAATELREHLRQWKWVARIWGVFSKWFYNKLRR